VTNADSTAILSRPVYSGMATHVNKIGYACKLQYVRLESTAGPLKLTAEENYTD